MGGVDLDSKTEEKAIEEADGKQTATTSTDMSAADLLQSVQMDEEEEDLGEEGNAWVDIAVGGKKDGAKKKKKKGGKKKGRKFSLTKKNKKSSKKSSASASKSPG